MWAAVNRVGRRDKGATLDAVVNQKNAFEALKKGDLWGMSANPSALTGPNKDAWDKAGEVARGILNGSIPDPTGGATMFLPAWAYHPGDEASTPGDYPRMFREGRLAPSPYNSSPDWKAKNYFFVELPPHK